MQSAIENRNYKYRKKNKKVHKMQHNNQIKYYKYRKKNKKST